jgi:hypothetical protein
MKTLAATTEDRRQERAEVTRSEWQQRAKLVGDVILASPRFLVAPLLRPWHLRWGATDGEVSAPMPGDGVIDRPSFNATRAITVAAPPAEVWPWLVQIGFGRAGWYSYDLFDNAAKRSPDSSSVPTADTRRLGADGGQDRSRDGVPHHGT